MKTKLHLLLIALFFGFSLNAQVTSVSVTGSGVAGGWNVPAKVYLTSSDGINYTKLGLEIFGDRQLKFVENASWGTYAGSTVAGAWPSGTVVVTSGLFDNTGSFNIVAPTAGFYDVTVNVVTGAYTFTPGYNHDQAIFFSGGGLLTDQALSTYDGINYSKESVTFPVGGGNGQFFELSSVINPSGPYGTWKDAAFPIGIGTSGGTPIPVIQGTFYLNIDATTGEYNFADTVVNLVGGFNGWNPGSNAAVLSLSGVNNDGSSDNIHYKLDNFVLAADTDLEFVDNHSWNFEFPTSDATGVALVGTAIRKGTGTSSNIHVPAGTYNVTFNRSTLAYSFTNALAVNKFDANKFSVYPNPTKNSWNFTSGNSDITSVKIVDMLGKTVMSKKSAAKEVSVDASSLSKGMYFAEITSGDSVQTVKVIRD